MRQQGAGARAPAGRKAAAARGSATKASRAGSQKARTGATAGGKASAAGSVKAAKTFRGAASATAAKGSRAAAEKPRARATAGAKASTTGSAKTPKRSRRAPVEKPRKAPAAPSVRAPTGGAAQRIEALIETLGDWRGERLAEIRRLIHEVDPAVVEEWKWMGTPVWSHSGMYVLANAHKDKVKVTFFHGAKLPDPKGLFNAGLGGNKWRAIDLREGDRLDAAAFKELLRAAIAYNETHAVPKSRGAKA